MNSIYRLKDKYEDGIKELKKEQKRKEPEYLKKWKITLIILGSLAIIAIMFSGFYFLKTYNYIPVIIIQCVSAIICLVVTTVMEVLQHEYENGWDRTTADSHYNEKINTLKKWKKAHKSNNLKKNSYKKLILRLYCLKWMMWVTIVLGVILIGVIIGLIFLHSIFKFDEIYLSIIGTLSIVVMSVYFLWITNFLEKQPYHRRKKVTITDTDWKRLAFLKNLLEKEKFCFDDIAKIQIIIDELTRMKKQVIPFVDINQFIIKPLIILWIPLAIVFFDYWIKGIGNNLEAYFLVIILAVIVSLGILIFMITEPLRYLLYGKYDALISDLRLLQITKEEKDNQ